MPLSRCRYPPSAKLCQADADPDAVYRIRIRIRAVQRGVPGRGVPGRVWAGLGRVAL